MDSGSRKKIIFSVTAMFVAFLLTNLYLDSKTKAFEMYIGDAVIGYSSSKEEAKSDYSSIIDNLNRTLKDEEKIHEEKISFKRISDDVKLSTYNEIEENVLKTMSDEVTLKSFNIDNKKIGYVLDKDDMNETLSKVGSYYAKANNIDRDKIASINVKGNINLKEEKVKISNLNNSDYLADKIVKENKNAIDVDLVVNDKQVVDIEPIVKIERTDNLLLGESKVKEEGKKGKKEQVVNVTYRNGKKIDTKVLSENIIESSKSKVVYKGTKSPIDNNFAFLSSPTRGGVVTSTFGERWGKLHKGMDIAGNIGDPVMAAFDGVVKSVFYERDGYGKVVILEHEDGLETRYAHMSEFEVKEGDKVKKGDLVGRVGNTGRSTGPHLHFELRVNGNPVNPEGYIN